MKQNNWLLTQIYYRYELEEDPRGLLALTDSLKPLSPEVIREAAQTYLNTNNYVRITLYPEKEKEKE